RIHLRSCTGTSATFRRGFAASRPESRAGSTDRRRALPDHAALRQGSRGGRPVRRALRAVLSTAWDRQPRRASGTAAAKSNRIHWAVTAPQDHHARRLEVKVARAAGRAGALARGLHADATSQLGERERLPPGSVFAFARALPRAGAR